MAFVNEYIPETDYDKHDLRRVCSEHNLPNRGQMHSRSWTIDREADAFLLEVWAHPHSETTGWAFCWKGAWLFFEMAVKRAIDNPEEDSCWSHYQVFDFALPAELRDEREQVVDDLCRAYSAYAGGGVFGRRTHRRATVEFVGEL